MIIPKYIGYGIEYIAVLILVIVDNCCACFCSWDDDTTNHSKVDLSSDHEHTMLYTNTYTS